MNPLRHLSLIALLILAIMTHASLEIVRASSFADLYNVSYITMEEGLPNNGVEDMVKDDLGFLWVATDGSGVSRYDGYGFVYFDTNSKGSPLRSNFVQKLCIDSFNRLWIATESGVDVLDLTTNSLVEYEQIDQNVLNQYSTNVIEDKQKNIWVNADRELHKITVDEKGEVVKSQAMANVSRRSYFLSMSDIEENGSVWVAVGHNIYRVGEGVNEYDLCNETPVLSLAKGTTIFSMVKKEGEVWIGTDKALYRYDLTRQILRAYYSEKDDPSSLSQNHITDISITESNQLLVSTFMGLNIYNSFSDNFERVMAFTADSEVTHLNSNFVNCVEIDGDRIWVGTATGGINKFETKRLPMKNYVHSENNPYTISANPVNAILVDETENLWVGTVEGGLNYKEKSSDRFMHYTTENANLSHNSVSSIIKVGKNQLWIGTWGAGINVFDVNERRAVRHINSFSTEDNNLVDFVGTMVYDEINNGVWIGANQGLFFFDIDQDRLVPIQMEGQMEINGYLGTFIDREGYLWVGGLTGLFVIDLQSFTPSSPEGMDYRHLKFKLDKPESHIYEKITSFTETSDGTIWIGSNGNGLYKRELDDDNQEYFVAYTTRNGLPSNNIKGITEGRDGNMWIATNNGLAFLNPKNGYISTYTQSDGIISNQFYWNGVFRMKNKIYLGSTGGLTIIEDLLNGDDTLNHPVILTRLYVENNEVYAGSKFLDRDISYSSTLNLHERNKSVSIEFASPNYKASQKALYKYRLLGFDDKWVTAPSSRRVASYTNLDPGDYLFQVQFLNDQQEEGTVSELAISVKPYFYKTAWFYTVVLLFIALALWYFMRLRAQKYLKAQLSLQKKVEARTVELKKQKELLETQTRELSVQNKILKQQNVKINKQKEQLVDMSERIQELTTDKIAFFTNITHEFRTPITLILGPLKRALKLSSNPEVKEQLNFVERNSAYLLSLVNQIMDFRKVESNQFELERRIANYKFLINSVYASFVDLARMSEIELRNLVRLSSDFFVFDEQELQKVLMNLVNNAVKFTPAGGRITLYSATIWKDGKKQLYFSISDTGSGIDQADIPYIFDRFYQATNKGHHYPQQLGTGIGLFLCKQIIEKHGGEIEVKSSPTHGTTFRFVIPFEEGEQATLLEVGELKEVTQEQLIIDDVQVEVDELDDERNTILVVEDNDDMRLYIQSILKDYYNVLNARNGEEALAILKRENVDFIISDLMMPVMDGLELSRRVKSDFEISHIPFLMLTAKSSAEARIESFKVGVDEYLLKPFDEELLLARISSIFENQRRYKKRFIYEMNVDDIPIEGDSRDKQFLDSVMTIIKDNYKDSYFDVGDFADAVGISRSLLNKKLQSLTGQSPGQFIRNYRLNVSRELIIQNRKTQNLNVSEVAYEVGFNDPKYFSRCFSRHFNVAPSVLMEDG